MGGVQFYAQKDFLLNFFRQRPLMDSLEEEEWEKASQWRDFFELLLRSTIQIDLGKEEILNLQAEDPIFKKLFKKETGSPKAMPGLLEEALKDDQHFIERFCRTIFLLEGDQNSCSRLREDFGMLFFGRDSELKELADLVETETLTFKKGPSNENEPKWSFLDGVLFPSNSMVILDNYIFSGNYGQNLPSFLDRILPNKLGKSAFHLTIITYDDNGRINVKKGFEDLLRILEELDRSYEIRAQVFVSKEFHDRELITNYYWIHSGFGFNLYTQAGIAKDTVLMFFPIGAKLGRKLPGKNSPVSSTTQMLLQFRKAIEKIPPNGKMGAISLGFGDLSFRNRLLEDTVLTNHI